MEELVLPAEALEHAAALARIEVICCTLEGLNPLVDRSTLVEDIIGTENLSFLNYLENNSINLLFRGWTTIK